MEATSLSSRLSLEPAAAPWSAGAHAETAPSTVDHSSELWAVVQAAQQRQNWQINVLLFAEAGSRTVEFAHDSMTQGANPLTLEIAPLSDSERDRFIDAMMMSRQLDAAQRRKIRQQQ